VTGLQALQERFRRAEPTVRRLAPWAGPVLIVGSVLLVLSAFAFGGRLTTQHIDLLPQWLPNYCFLGRSLAAGHIPAWNPYTLSGTPFAADPQSGWTYLPAMALFTAFSCDRALRYLVVLQPILAGLGIYWFLRSERLSRVSATAAGLVLAMVMADSYIALSMPFAGTLAWTALLLAAASRLMRAESWPRRLGWLLAVALVWGQLADAHMSNGLLIGTAALLVYVGVRVGAAVRARDWRGPALSAALLLLALPLINVAVFLPRLPFIHRSSLGLGYLTLQRASESLRHTPARPFEIGASSEPSWPLGFSTAPGSYLGAVALGLAFAGWRVRRQLPLVIAFAVFGAVGFVLSLQPVAKWAMPHVVGFGPAQIWLHEPVRFRYAVLLAVTILVGFGVEAWMQAGGLGTRIAMVAPGIVVFLVLPPLLHVTHDHTGFVVAMALVAVVVLVATALRPTFAFLIPAMLAAELVANGFIGHGVEGTVSGIGVAHSQTYVAWAPLRQPEIDAAAYVRQDTLALALQQRSSERYAVTAFQGTHRRRGFLLLQKPQYWPLQANQRSVIFHLRDSGGYNPAQLLRYWTFVRAVDSKFIKYNGAFLSSESKPVAFDLLQVAWQIGAVAAQGVPGVPEPVATDGEWALYPRSAVPPLASAVTSWEVVGSPGAGLAAVLASGFDPETSAVLERDPGVAEAPGSQTESLTSSVPGPQEVRVDVRRDGPAVVVIRVPFDVGWHVTVDGRPADVLHADYVDMGVAVPAGAHRIEFTYDDPRIGYGLLASGLFVIALGGAAIAAALVRRRRRRSAPPP
jgi:membrane protein YfhO